MNSKKYLSKTFQELNSEEDIIFAIKDLRLLIRELVKSISFIIERAKHLLQEHLTAKSDHQPGAALMITFLKLFRHAQNKLNGLTKRHLEYYYKRILHQKPLEAIADKVHVFFDINPAQFQHYLPEKTLLFAGRDDNCLLYTSPSPRDLSTSRMPSSA